ncbi:hypothetical protein Aeqsu_1621 [Aequorivita sublithincola DSM 14238]|uniref:DUF4260 domain-containing protein n=1 Tax=Aequorivita sublithincola (strain DSM 14238 / LMG 21431 / ACAM 643 / 9-3) TaxID=746697 RepID=I3YVT7_AEQSU|nr:DUF4260 domain-containing protein [Aequorivita sublithincola]AFL81105.1 hypothetical protein Aeqsu_1621 [Aequorivita sublithincola DSM 14238]
MKTTIRLEELAQFILGIVLFSQLDYAWWWFPALILTPDIGAVGYLINTKVGAFTYNFFHHKAVAIAVGLCAFYLDNSLLILIGVILFSHAALDRIFGYGLKYPDSFKNTHLGDIGK